MKKDKEKFLKVFYKNKKHILSKTENYIIYFDSSIFDFDNNKVDECIIDLNELNRRAFIDKWIGGIAIDDEDEDYLDNSILEVRKVYNYIFIDGSILKVIDAGTIGGEQLYEIDAPEDECFANEFNSNNDVINFGYDTIESYNRSVVVNNIIKIDEVETFLLEFPTKEELLRILMTGELNDIECLMETLKTYAYYIEDYMQQCEESEVFS